MNARRWACSLSFLLLASPFFLACSAKQTPTPPPLPPKLSFDKEQVSLGTVPLDHWGSVTFLAVNKGESLLKLGPFSLEAQQGDADAKPPQGTIEVKPGESVVLPVEFQGHKTPGLHRLSLRLSSNDPGKPTATLTMAFNVAEQPTPRPERPGPRLRVDKELVDDGLVPSDHPLYERFTLRNDGDAPLVLKGVPLVKVLDGC